LHEIDGPGLFDGHPLGHLIGLSHLYAQSRVPTFQHLMAYDRSGPEGLHMRAITASSKSVYRCLPGTPTVFHTRAPKWSAARIFAAMSAPRLRPLPSSRHLAPPSGPSQHPSIVVTEPPCSLLDALATSAPFFAPARRIRPFLSRPPLPPSAHHARCAALRYVFSSMCSSSFPVPPPSPSRGVYSSVILFLRHLIASAVDLPLRVAARRVLRLYALLTTSLC